MSVIKITDYNSLPPFHKGINDALVNGLGVYHGTENPEFSDNADYVRGFNSVKLLQKDEEIADLSTIIDSQMEEIKKLKAHLDSARRQFD